MITAIVSKDDATLVSKGLTDNGFYVTKLATTGGFLQVGNVTLMIGTEDEKVDAAIDVIRAFCRHRTQATLSQPTSPADAELSVPVEVSVGGATVFVTNVERFERL